MQMGMTQVSVQTEPSLGEANDIEGLSAAGDQDGKGRLLVGELYTGQKKNVSS